MRKRLMLLTFVCIFLCVVTEKAITQIANLNDEAYLLLALKKAKARYEQVRIKYERSQAMLNKGLISAQDFEEMKRFYLIEETNYQQAYLRVIFDQPHILIEKAIKYQTEDHKKRVKLSLRNTTGGTLEYQKLMVSGRNGFADGLEPDRIRNVFVSIMNTNNQTIIGQPYEIKIDELEFSETKTIDFLLLVEDVEEIKVSMTYSNKTVQKDIYLQKDIRANMVYINSSQFSQEVDLGSQATFDLNLELFSANKDVYKLMALNLPHQISYDFIDSESNARLSQVKFIQGINTKKLALKIYLPARDDQDVVIDKPLIFYALALSKDQFDKFGHNGTTKHTLEEIDNIKGGKVKLEIIPRGVGKIEVNAPSLYHEISVGDSVIMEMTLRNTGTRHLNNIKIKSDSPLRWRAIIAPDLIRELAPDKEVLVSLSFMPPIDVGIGAQEIKIKTEALADNRPVEAESKVVRVQIKAHTPLLWTTILIIILVGLVIGVVVFSTKMARR